MFNQVLADLFSLQALVLFLLLLIGVTEVFGQVPQTYRVFKSRDAAGMSSFSMGVSMCNYVLWSVYYFSRNLEGLLIVNSAATIIYAVLVVGAVRAGIRVGRAAIFAAVYFSLTLVAFLYAPLILPLVLLGGAAFMFYSAAYAAFRADSISGLSPATWTGLLLCGLASVALGFTPGEKDMAVAAWGGICASASLLILALIWAKSRSAHAFADAVLHDAEDIVDEAVELVHDGLRPIEQEIRGLVCGRDAHEEDCVCA